MNNRLVPTCTLNLSVCAHISVYNYTGRHFHRYFTLPKSQLRLYQRLKKPSNADDVTHSHKRPGFETKGGRRKASRHAYWANSSRPVSCFPIMALLLPAFQCCQIPPSLHGRFCQKPRPVWTLSLPAKSFFTAGFTADFMATLRLHFYLFHEKNHISNPLTHTHMHQYNKPHSRDMFQTSLLYSEQCQRVIKYITTQ